MSGIGRTILGLLAATLAAEPAVAVTGNELCDLAKSTATTCVITGGFTIPDDTLLTFTAPDVELRGNLTVAFSGQCSLEPFEKCASDAECLAPARCERTGRLTLRAAGTLTVRGQVIARGEPAEDDAIGPDGGTLTLEGHDVSVAGLVDTSADAVSGVVAGSGGRIAVRAANEVEVTATGRLNASTARGGCGGAITIDGSLRLVAAGELSVEGASRGGTIDLNARNYVSVEGALLASNTNGDLATRTPCELAPPDGRGGGSIGVRARRVAFKGAAKARGREAGGGVIRLEGERSVVVDSAVGISVLGGDLDRFTSGGGVFLVASGGDVSVLRGAIEADGLGSGLGSDAGQFEVTAAAERVCATSEQPCASADDCAVGEGCIERGGNVVVAALLSAAGGAGAGSGCFACEIRGSANVTVSGSVKVGGGKSQGTGGKVTIAAGNDLTLGIGSITADAADGGDLFLTAGERATSARDVGGTLRILSGTLVEAKGFRDDGVGGHVEIEGCDVEVESTAAVRADGGSAGGSDGVDIVAKNRLVIGPLALLSALPGGTLALSYRGEVAIAPDAVLQPPTEPILDPSLSPCPACGNGFVDPLEDCDGSGSCPDPLDVCMPPGTPGACTCRDTCGTIPGIQTGEDCDGNDLGGETCLSLGFSGGALACHDDCTLDTSGCTEEVCGDGQVGPSEACDPGGIGGAPPSFGDETCETRGYPGGGTLTCTADCGAIISEPHCAGAAATTCSTDVGCPGTGPCTGGCVACGNGFRDPGEECDEGGDDNGSAGNHCRSDCTLPRCGDDTVDFPHCASDPDALCTSAADCGGEACLAGEACDLGEAHCSGGTNDGGPCCRATDCPGGTCDGADCTRNRDDLPGCCRCDCTRASACGDCDDGNPCTTDTCDPVEGCTHAAVGDGAACADANACNGAETCRAGVCVAGLALDCDDGNPCTADACEPVAGCAHPPAAEGTACADSDACDGLETCRGGVCMPGPAPTCNDGDACTADVCIADVGCANFRFGVDDAARTLAASVFVPACSEGGIPRSLNALLRRARTLVGRAEQLEGSRKATRLLGRAMTKLRRALVKLEGRSSARLDAACRAALVAIAGDALARVECVAGP